MTQKIDCFVEQTFKNPEKTIVKSEIYIYTHIDEYTQILIRAMNEKGYIINRVPFGIGERYFIKNPTANFEQTKKDMKKLNIFRKKVIGNKVFNQ